MAAEEVKRNFVTRNQRYLHGFRGAWLLLLSAILICVLAQHLIPLLFSDEKRLSILSLSAYAALVLFLIFLYFRIRQLVSTPFFATTSLLGIAAATAIGTFIAQNLPYQQFDRRYGSLSSALRFLHIDDIFHSWWFAGLFIMLSISLIGITSHYRFTLKNIGFYLAHLSPLIILLGFWIDFYAGFKGFIGLQTGNQSNTVARFFRNTTAVLDTVDLDFAIRLDSFSTEKFEPDYRIQIWKKNTDRDGGPGTNNEEMSQQSPQLVTTVSLDTNKVHHIFGENISFEIREVYRDLQFTYSHPAYDSTSPVQDPGIILKVKTPVGQQRAILKAFDSALNSIEDPHVDAWVKYYWEIPDSVKKELQPVAAKWREKNWIIIEGRNRKMIRIFGENLSSEKVALAQFYQFSDTRPDEGFVITHISGFRGDVRSHLMAINVDTASMFTADGSAVKDDDERSAALSPHFSCLGCHNNDPDDNIADKTIEEAVLGAANMHNSVTAVADFLDQSITLDVYPNPAIESATIHFSMAQAGKVNIKIFNAIGDLVFAEQNTYRPAGDHTLTWNGLSNIGINVTSGMYFVNVGNSSSKAVKRFILTK